jgi:hypothetical protein
MFFDREEEIQELAFETVRSHGPAVTPIEAIGKLAHDLVARDHEFVMLSAETSWFIETAMKSEALRRAWEMRDDFTRALAKVLAEASGRPSDDPNAHPAAGLIISPWNVAFAEAQKVFDRSRDAGEAKRCFLALIGRGIAGALAALAGTSYA